MFLSSELLIKKHVLSLRNEKGQLPNNMNESNCLINCVAHIQPRQVDPRLSRSFCCEHVYETVFATHTCCLRNFSQVNETPTPTQAIHWLLNSTIEAINCLTFTFVMCCRCFAYCKDVLHTVKQYQTVLFADLLTPPMESKNRLDASWNTSRRRMRRVALLKLPIMVVKP